MLGWGLIVASPWGATMTLHNSHQSFVLEVELFALFIRMGRYELSWNGDGLCICKGMKTVWSNWH
jgi:hypothetical protein